MVDTVIVALPREDDRVNRIASGTPHLTLMYLGEEFDMDNLESVTRYLKHIAETSLHRFGLSVDRRGTLGDKDADVLFFEDGWQTENLKDVIGYLLADDHLSVAYNQQRKKFPKWVPHLTLGYPDKPAKKPQDDDDGRIWYVDFDRIAIWTGDSEGPEFLLKKHSYSDELAMSEDDVKHAETLDDVYETIEENLDDENLKIVVSEELLHSEEFTAFIESEDFEDLKHYGVKGMRWGIRKSDRVPTGVALTTQPGRKVKAKGGKFEAPSEDAKRTAIQKQKAKSSSTDSLSNTELKQMIERMQLEANYKRLAQQESGAELIKKLLLDPKYRNRQVESISELSMPVRKGAGMGIAGATIGRSIRKTDLSKIGR